MGIDSSVVIRVEEKEWDAISSLTLVSWASFSLYLYVYKNNLCVIAVIDLAIFFKKKKLKINEN